MTHSLDHARCPISAPSTTDCSVQPRSQSASRGAKTGTRKRASDVDAAAVSLGPTPDRRRQQQRVLSSVISGRIHQLCGRRRRHSVRGAENYAAAAAAAATLRRLRSPLLSWLVRSDFRVRRSRFLAARRNLAVGRAAAVDFESERECMDRECE